MTPRLDLACPRPTHARADSRPAWLARSLGWLAGVAALSVLAGCASAPSQAPAVAWPKEAAPSAAPCPEGVPAGARARAYDDGAADDDAAWHVRIELRARDGAIQLTVRDRGPGLPAGFTLSGHPSLGLQLVTTLVRQLRGKVQARSDGGALFQIDFPLG